VPVLPHLLPALITPFDRAGELDREAHRHNLITLWDRGIKGFVIGGSTGEGPYLEPGERRALTADARDALGESAYLICGVNAETVRLAQPLIEEAAAGGANAALVITPTTLTRNRVPYVESFYTTLADAAPLPLFLYSVPSVTAFELPDEAVARLAAHPNIVGIKDSGGHPVRLQRILANVSEDFTVFTGSTQAVTLAIAAGAHGAITASTNYMPERVSETVAAARRQPADARPLQHQISRISAAIEAYGIPGVKAMAAHAGLRPGWPRLPLQPLPKEDSERLGTFL
jgi:dihydrodipicolinate synthase/N-acetylneuraminate lyase